MTSYQLWNNVLCLRRSISKGTLQKKEAENEKAMEKEADERNQALEIRQIAMETMGQTKKRSSDNEIIWTYNVYKAMDYLRQKLELDKKNLAAEREEKRNQNAILMN